jgi:hypothetical protein
LSETEEDDTGPAGTPHEHHLSEISVCRDDYGGLSYRDGKHLFVREPVRLVRFGKNGMALVPEPLSHVRRNALVEDEPHQLAPATG